MSGWGSIWGAAINAASTRAQRMSDKHMYERQWNREFAMANSAHQREVKDLIAAGLNPILSAGGGGAANVSPTPPPDPGFGIDGVTTAKAFSEIANIKQNTKKQRAETKNTQAETKIKENLGKISDAAGKGGNLLNQGADTIKEAIEWGSSTARDVGSKVRQWQDNIGKKDNKAKPELYIDRKKLYENNPRLQKWLNR